MSISDTLFDALEEIERYEKETPYAESPDLLAMIEPVKKSMRDLMIYLDTPPDQIEIGKVIEHETP